MKLHIDTTDRHKITIGLDEKKFEMEISERNSGQLLAFIDKTLKSERLDKKDIKEIEINTGPGSFTGIRIGVAVVNTLAWQLKIPVNNKNSELDIIY